ncbi:hypothetical protein FOA52_011187 [Chlamydomonas sp. UWO 241]|nr:hypothetical protein FOA52_011187 [Chlamydomonas sp. UWO 241]
MDALFNHPKGVDVDPVTKDVYVSDTGNEAVRMIDGTTGAVNLLAGQFGGPGYSDGVGASARVNQPIGVVYTAGNV